MNLIRSLISVFVVAVVMLVVSGLKWAASQPSPKSEGATFALAMCGLFCVGGLYLLWSTKQPDPNEHESTL
jgi:hypothetical protein